MQIMEMLRDNIPSGIYEAPIRRSLILSAVRAKGVFSLGFIFAMIASTNGMMSLMRSFDMVYEDTGNPWVSGRFGALP
jgi:membrane protein